MKVWPAIASAPSFIVVGKTRKTVAAGLPAGPTAQDPVGVKVLPPPAQVIVTPLTKEPAVPELLREIHDPPAEPAQEKAVVVPPAWKSAPLRKVPVIATREAFWDWSRVP